MWRSQSKTEQPILSKELKSQEKLKDFRQYLVEKDVVLLIVKFLLSIKNSKVQPDNLTQAFKDYLGECSTDNSQFEELKNNLEAERVQTTKLLDEIASVSEQIRLAKEQKTRKEQEQRLRLEQQAQKKDSKKPGKK